MPSQHQSGTRTAGYETEAHRHVARWPDQWLLRLEPMTDTLAKQYLQACATHDVSDDVQEHFTTCLLA